MMAWNVYIDGKRVLTFPDGTDGLRQASAQAGEWLCEGYDYGRVTVEHEELPALPEATVESLFDSLETAENSLLDAYNIAYKLDVPAMYEVEKAFNIVVGVVSDIQFEAEREGSEAQC